MTVSVVVKVYFYQNEGFFARCKRTITKLFKTILRKKSEEIGNFRFDYKKIGIRRNSTKIYFNSAAFFGQSGIQPYVFIVSLQL